MSRRGACAVAAASEYSGTRRHRGERERGDGCRLRRALPARGGVCGVRARALIPRRVLDLSDLLEDSDAPRGKQRPRWALHEDVLQVEEQYAARAHAGEAQEAAEQQMAVPLRVGACMCMEATLACVGGEVWERH